MLLRAGLVSAFAAVASLFTLIPLVQASEAAHASPASPIFVAPPMATSTASPPLAVRERDAVRGLDRRQGIVFQTCPEVLPGHSIWKCDDPRCGGSSKKLGVCDKKLLTGPQDDDCGPSGCGTFCNCDPGMPIPPRPFPIIVGACPEAIGKPALNCSDCGGDSKVPGVCDFTLLNGPQDDCQGPGGCGYRCLCVDGNSTTPVPHPVTVTSNGQTAVATYSATFLSKYSSLRASTTITTSISPAETAVPIVIFAGGFAWWLFGLTGPFIPKPPGGPPEGGEEDDANCLPPPQCDDLTCGGKNPLGLCSAGSKAFCPCEDEKQQCPNSPPQCGSGDCGADNGLSRCSKSGKLKDCQCCPADISCTDVKCHSSNDKKCDGNLVKGCACKVKVAGNSGPIIGFPDQKQFISTPDQLGAIQQQILQDLFGGDLDKYLGINETKAHPSKFPTCFNDSTNAIPQIVVVNGGSNTTVKDLHYRMRQVLCTNNCAGPEGVPASAVAATKNGDSCEIAIALPNSIEAFAYRGARAVDSEQQDCWDSFANITETCNLGTPNVGWVNGPKPYEFFEAGYRPLNNQGSLHKPFDPSNALQTPSAASPPATSSSSAPPSPPSPPPAASSQVLGIAPTGTSLTCVDAPLGGFLGDCVALANRFRDDEQICTNDPKYCPARGTSYCRSNGRACDPNGEASDPLPVASNCVLAAQQSCAIVVADKFADFGFPGYSCFTGADVKRLIAIEQGTSGCGAPPSQPKFGAVVMNQGAAAFCLTGAKGAGLCII